ncbi:hypothetical protein PAPYR_6571 [Paratrimastix pyriformis]|uniref:Uncharacterized protein n=1 Tax=Paratrimastix pyriformis TaxID=342808 RepID=A0ABQ8UJK5_9EUKA|nr:hypothetical protein PAPYR_6571 [Paratrimastix pyriformis]
MESPIPQEEPVEPLPKPREQPRCYRRRHIDLTETDPAKRKVEYRVKYNAMRKAEAGKSEKYITVDVEDELVAALAQVLEKTIEEAKPLAEKLVLRIKLNRTEQASKNTLLAPFLSLCHLPSTSPPRCATCSQAFPGPYLRVPLAPLLFRACATCFPNVPGYPPTLRRGCATCPKKQLAHLRKSASSGCPG